MNKCSVCNQEATVQLIEIDTKGCMQKVYLCPTHAEQQGLNKEHSFNLMDGLSATPVGAVLSNHICPFCGCTKEWILAHKRMGCPICYHFSQNYLDEFRCQQTVYMGKIPTTQDGSVCYQPRLRYWNDKLERFAKNDQFEKAQQCKKQVKIIERALKRASTHL